MADDKDVITRFAPSPTGFLHIGGVRTALFSYIYTKQNGGKFALRIEDTDKERSKEEYTKDIVENLKWLGLEHDIFAKQSERSEIYKKYLEKLVNEGKAYLSKEEVTEEGQRAEVVRFKNPNKKIVFNDLIRGDIEFDTTELKDFVIAKSLDEPVYHLAVVVDDFEMGVTHVIRGDDGISNTPRQILIQEAIGAPRPIYAHLPMMLAPDKTKLSKRKHGEQVSVSYYKKNGYLPEAIINFLAMVGWNPGTDQEIFSMDELIKTFDIKKVQKKGAIFNIEKLRWINKEYVRSQKNNTDKEIGQKLKEKFGDRAIHPKLVGTLFERIEVISDIDELIKNGELDYFFDKPELDKEKICWKTQASEKAKENLEKVIEILDNKEKIMELAEKEGKGNVLWPLRYALSGREKSPDPFTLIDILGIEESKERIGTAIEVLSKN